jgi:hypothetical protein
LLSKTVSKRFVQCLTKHFFLFNNYGIFKEAFVTLQLPAAAYLFLFVHGPAPITGFVQPAHAAST